MSTPLVPRKTLLPPYMSAEAWQDLADVIDEVFGEQVDPFIDALKYLRETFIYDDRVIDSPDFTPHPVQASILNRDLIDASLFDTYDTITERLRLNQLGLRVLDPTVLDLPAVNRLVQNIGAFWYIKGTEQFLDFISFILNTDVKYYMLWTRDYVHFLKENNPAIGTPVWAGGQWYPTTHIRLDISESNLAPGVLVNFVRLFYDISNYNLVLESIEQTEWNFILPVSMNGTYPTDGYATVPIEAPIVGCAYVVDRIEYLSSPDL